MLNAQNPVLDKVVAVVGNNLILKSDIETQFLQMNKAGDYEGIDLKCKIFEDLLYQNLLTHHAEIDSVEVTEREVSDQLDRRLRYFVQQVGSEKKLEEYFGKSISQIKSDLRENLKNQLLAERMESKITEGVKVTPAEVRLYFKNLPVDSIPYIDEELELEQIAIYPEIPDEIKLLAKEKLNEIRERIVNGENFATLAQLYSEDPGSIANNKGGELGFVGRTDLVPEFTAVAFNLKEGEVSKIVETQFGYHIIQMIERRGELINVRHILIIPKVPSSEAYKSKTRLDSIITAVRTEKMTFAEAVDKYSQDEASNKSNGLIINPITGNSRFKLEQLAQVDQITSLQVKKLKVGEYTDPYEFYDENGKKGYKIVRLKSRTKAHDANINDDYQVIQEMTIANKKHEAISNWISKKSKITYIQIDDSFANCPFTFTEWIKKK
jgi:peptidyl-prolyl cis-trans isomerase SurA